MTLRVKLVRERPVLVITRIRENLYFTTLSRYAFIGPKALTDNA